MAVTDASLAAHLAAGVLFVVAADQTKGPAAANALTQLDSANARFVGTVLNGVNFKRDSFYYGEHYSREYGDYYSAPTSETAATTTAAKETVFDLRAARPSRTVSTEPTTGRGAVPPAPRERSREA